MKPVIAIKYTLFIVFLLYFSSVFAQKIEAKVEVNSQQITGVNKEVFRSLQENMQELLNNTSWIDNKNGVKDKIRATFLLTIDSRMEDNMYSGSLQIQADRIVFNSSYRTPLLNHKDKQVLFSYIPNENLEFIKGGRNNNLVAIFAYYAYLIIALDADSFSRFGGSDYFKEVQYIVNQQEQTSGSGWSSADKVVNRYWIVEDFLNYKDLREAFYTYHIQGLDKMVVEPREALLNMTECIKSLVDVYEKEVNASSMHVFFDAKARELVECFSVLPADKKNEMYMLLGRLSPGHLGIYKGLE